MWCGPEHGYIPLSRAQGPGSNLTYCPCAGPRTTGTGSEPESQFRVGQTLMEIFAIGLKAGALKMGVARNALSAYCWLHKQCEESGNREGGGGGG